MTTTLQIKDHKIAVAEIIPLLENYRMLPQFLRKLIIDRAIADIEYTQAEYETVYEVFTQQHRLDSSAKIEAWLNKTGITHEQLKKRIVGTIKLNKFK